MAMIRVGGGGNFDIPKSLRSVVGDCVGNSVMLAVAGMGICGRGGSDGVVGAGGSSGGTTRGRRTGKGGGAGEDVVVGDAVEGPVGAEARARDTLGDAPNAGEEGLVGAGFCRGGGRGGRDHLGGARLPSLSLDVMLGSREMGCRGCIAGSLSSVELGERVKVTSLIFAMRPDGGSRTLAGRGGTAGLKRPERDSKTSFPSRSRAPSPFTDDVAVALRVVSSDKSRPA